MLRSLLALYVTTPACIISCKITVAVGDVSNFKFSTHVVKNFCSDVSIPIFADQFHMSNFPWVNASFAFTFSPIVLRVKKYGQKLTRGEITKLVQVLYMKTGVLSQVGCTYCCLLAKCLHIWAEYK